MSISVVFTLEKDIICKQQLKPYVNRVIIILGKVLLFLSPSHHLKEHFMRIKSVRIQNFKSFAEDNNRIDLEDINTIVGKNESGKSNLIQAIGKLDLTGIDDIYYLIDGGPDLYTYHKLEIKYNKLNDLFERYDLW